MKLSPLRALALMLAAHSAGPGLAAATAAAAATTATATATAAAATTATTDAGAHATADDLDRLMALLSRRQHGEADFKEKKYLSVLKQPLESSGVLVFDAPEHLEQRTMLPRPQSVVLDHGVLTMQLGRRKRTLRLADYPQLAPWIDCIRATLAGDRAALEREFALGFSGSLDHWQLRLEPRDAALSSTLKRIDIQGDGGAVRTVQVQQSDGDRSVMSITPRE